MYGYKKDKKRRSTSFRISRKILGRGKQIKMKTKGENYEKYKRKLISEIN